MLSEQMGIEVGLQWMIYGGIPHVQFFKEISYTFYFTGVYTSKDTADALPILYTLLFFNDYSTTYIQEEILDQLDFTKMIFLPSKITDQLTISTFKKTVHKGTFYQGFKI